MRRLGVKLGRSGDGTLALAFCIEGDLVGVRLPEPCTSRFAAELWKHTCLEAFVAVDGASAYHEYNFAPSGEWAVYAFDRYRVAAPIAHQCCVPVIAVRSTAQRFDLDAAIRLDRLSHAHRTAPLRLGLSAVIEADDGSLSYWAVQHPATERPDFHHADARAIRLAPPTGEW